MPSGITIWIKTSRDQSDAKNQWDGDILHGKNTITQFQSFSHGNWKLIAEKKTMGIIK